MRRLVVRRKAYAKVDSTVLMELMKMTRIIQRSAFIKMLALKLLIGAALVAPSLPVPTAAQNQEGTFQSYPLRHVRVDAIADQLKNSLGPNVDIVVDASRNRLLVHGMPQDQQIASELIGRFDQPVQQQIQQPALQPAAETRRVVRAYVAPQGQLDQIAAYVQSLYNEQAGLAVATDPRTNQLIIIATERIQGDLAGILAQRGLTPSAKSESTAGPVNMTAREANVDPREYRLQNITYREFEADLFRTWGKRLVVQSTGTGTQLVVILPTPNEVEASLMIDRGTNVVRFDGPQEVVESWRKAVEAIDVNRAMPGEDVRWLAFEKADPERVKRAISYLRLASSATPGTETVSTLPPQTNRSATPGVPDHLVRSIFRQQGQAVATTQVTQGTAGQEPATGQGDEQLAGDEAAEDSGGLYGPVELFFLEELGIIIVKGNPRDVERVNEIIKEIESISSQTQPEIELYPLKNVDSAAVAEVVQALYDAVYASRTGPVTITPLVKPNAVLIVGRKESAAFVIDLIDKLDVPVSPVSEFMVFRLKYMSATDMETRINDFYSGGQVGGEGRAGLGTRVLVTSDYRSNSLIVQASPRDLDEVGKLIEELDRATSDAVNEVKIVPLKNALAEELGPVLQDAINGQLQGAGRSDLSTQAQQNQNQLNQAAQVRSAMLQMMTIDKDGNKIMGSIMFDVRISWDTNSNSIIVTGPSEAMPLLEALIERLDTLPDAETQIKVFTIVNGDATTLVELLQTLFTDTQGGGGGIGQNSISSLPLQSGAGGDSSTLVTLRFGSDARTNSIIVSGSASDLEVVETLLLRLDIGDLVGREVLVYRLHNAVANDAATAINDWLAQYADIISNDPDTASIAEQIDRLLIVVPEPVTNSLIVSATPEQHQELGPVIEELDRRPPMVMCQVLIAEVLLDNFHEFGIETGIQDSVWFTRGIGDIGYPFNQSGIGNNSTTDSLNTREFLVGQGLANLALGRINTDLGYGGMVLSAGNESISLLLRALEQRTRVEVLSRPQIMTIDRLTAEVQVGQIVSRITGNTITNGISQLNLTDVDVGIILNVTPEVSPDGMITLSVNATRSQLGNEEDGTPVSVNEFGEVIRSPPIDIQTMQTSVIARSGQTVVLAGLITSRQADLMRGIPIISDIPVLGNFFRYDSENKERTELIFILTPHLVESDEDLAMINQVEMDRMSWCMAHVASVSGPIGYDSVPIEYHEGPVRVIHPDQDPLGKHGIIESAEELPAPTSIMEDPQSSLQQDSPQLLRPVRWQDPANGQRNAADGKQEAAFREGPRFQQGAPDQRLPRADGVRQASANQTDNAGYYNTYPESSVARPSLNGGVPAGYATPDPTARWQGQGATHTGTPSSPPQVRTGPPNFQRNAGPNPAGANFVPAGHSQNDYRQTYPVESNKAQSIYR